MPRAAVPEPISLESRVRLAPKARLRYDRKTDRYMLLYPEKGLVLNPTAADVAQLCTGEHTVRSIAAQLATKYSQDAATVEREVMNLLVALAERGLVQEAV